MLLQSSSHDASVARSASAMSRKIAAAANIAARRYAKDRVMMVVLSLFFSFVRFFLSKRMRNY